MPIEALSHFKAIQASSSPHPPVRRLETPTQNTIFPFGPVLDQSAPPAITTTFRSLLRRQTFRQRDHLVRMAIGTPCHAPIVEHPHNDPMQSPAQRSHSVPGRRLDASPQSFHHCDHRLTVEHTRYIMGNRGNQFTPAHCRHLRKYRGAHLPRHVGKGIAIEKQERCPPMIRLKKIQEFQERYFFPARFFPLFRARSSSL